MEDSMKYFIRYSYLKPISVDEDGSGTYKTCTDYEVINANSGTDAILILKSKDRSGLDILSISKID